MTKQFNTTEDQIADAVLEKKELKENQVGLSDGRIIEMREATGADELAVAGELGNAFQANGGGTVIYLTCLIVKTIISIDGKPVRPMHGYEAYREFAATFKSKDFTKIRNLYRKLSGDEEGNA